MLNCYFVSDVMTTVVVIDLDPRWWNSGERFSLVTNAVKAFVSAIGLSLPLPSSMDVAVISAFSDKAVTISQGPWRDVAEAFPDALWSAMTTRSSVQVYEPPIAQGVSRGLAYIAKRKVGGQIVVFECSIDPTDFSSQSVSLSNCVCDGSTRISVVSLAAAKPSSALLGLAARTSGIHIPYQFTQTLGSLVEALLFHVAPAVSQHLKVRPPESTQEMNATCACHNRVIDKGYVCSICLSIYCTDSAGICAVCGSRMRREAKDEMPVHAQVFSKLFSNSSGFPETQNIFS